MRKISEIIEMHGQSAKIVFIVQKEYHLADTRGGISYVESAVCMCVRRPPFCIRCACMRAPMVFYHHFGRIFVRNYVDTNTIGTEQLSVSVLSCPVLSCLVLYMVVA